MSDSARVSGNIQRSPAEAQIFWLTNAAREHINGVYESPEGLLPPTVPDPAEFLGGLPTSNHGSGVTFDGVSKLVPDSALPGLAQLYGIGAREHLLEALRTPRDNPGRRDAMYKAARTAASFGEVVLAGVGTHGKEANGARAEVRSAAGRLALHDTEASGEGIRRLFKTAAKAYRQTDDSVGATRNSLYRALHERSGFRGMAAAWHVGSAVLHTISATFRGQGGEAFGYLRRIAPHLTSASKAARGITDYRTV